MVTIEQKLLMFSNILTRSMNEKLAQEMERLRAEYGEKVKKSKEAADREADEIIKKAYKRAEAEKTEILSKIRVDIKKEYISARQKLFSTMMAHLTDEVKKFVRTEKYGDYLMNLAGKLAKDESCSGNLDIYMTAADIEKYADRFKEELLKLRHGQFSFKTADDSIIGGFIAVDVVNRIRFDFSVKTLLEDNKAYMMQELFRAIGAGDEDGTT